MTREASTLLIVHDAQGVFAGVGIHDPFAVPDVVRVLTLTQIVPARVGRRTDGTYLVGAQLTDAEAQGEQLVIKSPIEDGRIEDWDAMKALWYVPPPHAGTTSSLSCRCIPRTTPSSPWSASRCRSRARPPSAPRRSSSSS